VKGGQRELLVLARESLQAKVQAYPDPVSAVLEVRQAGPMPHALDLAELVLDKVEVVEEGVGVWRIGRVVVERRDGSKEVKGEVKRSVLGSSSASR
jgi:hypothetical protein